MKAPLIRPARRAGIMLNDASGAQLTPGEARVIDPILTEGVRGYVNANLIHGAIFPPVRSALRGGVRIEFDRTDFRKVNSRRSPGSATKRVHFGHEGVKFAIVQHALEGVVEVENQQEAEAAMGLDIGMSTAMSTMNLIQLECEIEAADLVRNADTYDAAHVLRPTGNDKWSNDASDPRDDIRWGVSQIRKATGMRPNTIAMGGDVFDRLGSHPKLLELVRYQGKDSIDEDDLARMWKVDRVVVGDAIYADEDDAAKDIWGDDVLLCYTGVGTLTRRTPSFGLRYELPGSPFAEEPYEDRNIKSVIYPVTGEFTNEVVGKDAGALIKDVL